MLNSPLEFVTTLNAYAVAFVIKIEKKFQDGSNLEPASIGVGVGVGVVLAAPWLMAFIYAGILALGVGVARRTEALALVHHEPVIVNISEPNMVSMFHPFFFSFSFCFMSVPEG